MDTDFTKLYRDYWSSNLEMKFRQWMSRLRMAVRERQQVGKTDHFNRIGTSEIREKTGKLEKIIYSKTESDQRSVSTHWYYWSEALDPEDIQYAVKDPSSEYYSAAISTLNQAIDMEIINAAIGSARTGEGGTTLVPLPDSQVVPVDFKWDGTTADSNLTEGKLRKARSLFGIKEAYDENSGEELFCVYSQRQVDALLGVEKAVNNDYVTQQNLREGKPTRFMGFNFIRTELAPKQAETDYRQVICFPKSAITLSARGGLIKNVSMLPDYHNAVQLYAAIQVGAVRNWEEKVAVLLCDETAAI